ncbi:MAG: hypothetical protein M5R36_14385 [Deltaproteobacteria bacterium]|nr:hypothetical protein [Deltaproteobacteria bacterium]
MKTLRGVLFLSMLAALIAAPIACVGSSDDDDDDDEAPSVGGDDDVAADDDDDGASPHQPADDFAEPYDPTAPGPYAVGVKTYIFVDESRDDYASRGKRTLLTEVWYPAPRWTVQLPRDKMRNFLGDWYPVFRNIAKLFLPEDELDNFEAVRDVARDVPAFAQGGPFPLVLISHGNSSIRFASMSVAEYLASHGYVVVAPDHIGNAAFVTLPDRFQIYNPILRPFCANDRVEDLIFLMDKFSDLTRGDPDGFFTGRIDVTRVGLVGHSYGAETVAETARRDGRVLAAVPMANATGITAGETDSAFMYMIGDEDHTTGDVNHFVRNRDYPGAPAPRFLLEFFNAGHYSFADTCIIAATIGERDGCGPGKRKETGEPFEFIDHDLAMEIISGYITAFFGYTIKHQDVMLSALANNLYPDEISLLYELEN